MEIVLQGMAVHVQSTACWQKALLKASNECTQLMLVGGQPNRFRWTGKSYLNEWVLHKSAGRSGEFNSSLRRISFPDAGLSHGFHGFQHYSMSFRLRAEASESPVISEDRNGDIGEEDKLSEEEWRRKNWIERGWAPWEEILTPEADFARKSLEENEGEALQSPETLEAFMKLTPRMYKKKLLEDGEQREKSEPRASQQKKQTEETESNGTVWNSPLVFTLIPPRDWPPPGWEVDPKELAFIREAHKLEAVRVDQKDLEMDPSEACFPRFRMFMKQYNEWVAANKDRLEKEALEVDQDYYPGRRRTGDDYKEGMYELPFVYPEQIYGGVVTCVHLYQGAFVNIGCVHDGWVPIKGNDWYWIRHHIKVGMHVQVEVLAKRDPYRFRFPIEMRFINPNIDHLIFNRFDYPPIFEREGDRRNLDEVSRETGRPFYPRRRLTVKPEDQPLLRDHPYTMEVWQLHVSEQMVLDEEERDPEEKEEDLKEKEKEKEFDQDVKEHDSDKVVEGAQWDQGYIEDVQLPKLILTTNIEDLDLDSARAERKAINKLWDEAEAQGKYFVIPKLRRQKQMDELDEMHKRRSIEEREALIRDISCRRELGLPLEEPGRYADDSFWGKNRYDPRQARFRNDYWGDPWELKKGSKKDREPSSARDEATSVNDEDLISSEWPSVETGNMDDNEESKIIGMSKEDIKRNGRKDTSAKNDRSLTSGNKRLVNGTESFSMGDVQGMFDNQGNWNDNGGETAASDTENE